MAPQLRSDGRTLALPRLMEYNPRRSELRRWLERILTNLFISHYCRPFYFRRSRFLEHLPETFTCQPEYFDPEPALLAEHDLDILEIWSARKRLLILLISGLWEKVPLRRRWAWSQEFSAILAEDLPTQAYTPKERIRVYSKLLGISRNRLSQEWSRSRGDLEGLKLIRNLRKI